MNINLHIERLILDGVPVEARDSVMVRTTVEAELGRLLSERGIPRDLQSVGNQGCILAPTLRLNSSSHANEIGTQIGAGIYSAFAGPNHER